jgi:hypothetical protein
VLGAEHALEHWQQSGELIAGARRVACLPRPVGQVVPDSEGVPVLGAGYPLDLGQQGGQLVAGTRRVA